MSTVCHRLHLQLGGCSSALSLSLSLSLSLLLSLFSGKLRLLRRLARIFKYTRVLSLPLNHIFILYLFAGPPSTCTRCYPIPTLCPPCLTHPLAAHLPASVGILIVYILHFHGVNKHNNRQQQQQRKNDAKYCEKTIEKKYETQRRRAEIEGEKGGATFEGSRSARRNVKWKIWMGLSV